MRRRGHTTTFKMVISGPRFKTICKRCGKLMLVSTESATFMDSNKFHYHESCLTMRERLESIGWLK